MTRFRLFVVAFLGLAVAVFPGRSAASTPSGGFMLSGAEYLCPGSANVVEFFEFAPGTYDFTGTGLTFSPSRDTFDANGIPSRMTATVDPHAAPGPMTATATRVGDSTPAAYLLPTNVAPPSATVGSLAQLATVSARCFHPGDAISVTTSGPGVLLPPTGTVAADGTASRPITIIPSSVTRNVTLTVTDSDGADVPLSLPVPPTTLRAGQTISDPGGTTPDLLSSHNGYWVRTDYCALSLIHVYQQNGVVNEPELWQQPLNYPVNAPRPCRLTLTHDGDLILYDHANHPLWQAGAQQTGTANTLVMQDDGNLIERTAAGVTVWSTRWGRYALPSGRQLTLGQGLRSGPYALLLETNGNLVLFASGRAIWQTHTAGTGGRRLLMQRDGNLVLYNGAGHSVWRSGTTRVAAGGYAIVKSGHLAIDNTARVDVWRTP